MAFPEDDAFQQQERTSSKLFTEYSLSALLAIVGLVGSFYTIMTYSFVAMTLLWSLIMTSAFDSILFPITICSLLMTPLGAYQLYQAYQLHKKSVHNFKMILMIAGLNMILTIVQIAGYASIQLIIGVTMLYAFSGVIVFNVIVVFLFSQSDVRSEFGE